MQGHKSNEINAVQVSMSPDDELKPSKSEPTASLYCNPSPPVCESLDTANTDCQPDNQGASCGKPHAMPDVQLGQRILYIGAGADADCCALAERVGPDGLVASVVPELPSQIHGYENLVFLVASVTELPIKDDNLDWVVSNRPLHIAGDHEAEVHELMRILQPGGRLAAPATLADTDLGSLWSPWLEAIKVHHPSVSEEVVIERAQESDLPDIQALMISENLPTDVEPHLKNFVVARHLGRVIGCSGMECLGTYGVLRSLAVTPAYRRCNLMPRLIKARNEIAIERGVTRAYNLTTTIASILEKRGYRRIDRSQVPPDILESSEFQQGKCAAATVMYWDFSDSATEAP